ncbi:hypothetical protein HY285_02895, partial [Candidatus Peregrinibacteria bacterium]|nr:hypothetical protein [Candidatus Peregrinibacteria bacterium]
KLENVEWDGPAIHALLHEVKTAHDILPKELFQPLYRIFLDRDDGPQMGWFLSTLPREEVRSVLDAVLPS